MEKKFEFITSKTTANEIANVFGSSIQDTAKAFEIWAKIKQGKYFSSKKYIPNILNQESGISEWVEGEDGHFYFYDHDEDLWYRCAFPESGPDILKEPNKWKYLDPDKR